MKPKVNKNANKNVRMKAARALKEMSQEDLAKAVGVTRQTIEIGRAWCRERVWYLV